MYGKLDGVAGGRVSRGDVSGCPETRCPRRTSLRVVDVWYREEWGTVTTVGSVGEASVGDVTACGMCLAACKVGLDLILCVCGPGLRLGRVLVWEVCGSLLSWPEQWMQSR